MENRQIDKNIVDTQKDTDIKKINCKIHRQSIIDLAICNDTLMYYMMKNTYRTKINNSYIYKQKKTYK